MHLIIGAAYSGKLTYAKTLCPSAAVADGETLDPSLPLVLPEGAVCLTHLEALTRHFSREGLDENALLAFLAPLFDESRTAFIVSREVGGGIVPMDPFERGFRELHGRLLQLLARRADSVTRIFCGIGEKLK